MMLQLSNEGRYEADCYENECNSKEWRQNRLDSLHLQRFSCNDVDVDVDIQVRSTDKCSVLAKGQAFRMCNSF